MLIWFDSHHVRLANAWSPTENCAKESHAIRYSPPCAHDCYNLFYVAKCRKSFKVDHNRKCLRVNKEERKKKLRQTNEVNNKNNLAIDT